MLKYQTIKDSKKPSINLQQQQHVQPSALQSSNQQQQQFTQQSIVQQPYIQHEPIYAQQSQPQVVYQPTDNTMSQQSISQQYM